MSWAIGYDDDWHRDIGYGVPAYCDYPGCMKEIDRGLAYVCGGEPYGGTEGCGLFFCEDHRVYSNRSEHQLCERCAVNHDSYYDDMEHYTPVEPFDPSPEHPLWIKHKLNDPSWKQWREENPDEVKRLSTI